MTAGPDLVDDAAPRALVVPLRRGRILGPALVVLTALVMLHVTWMRWAHPFIDAGREIYVAWRIAEGDLLFRDLLYLNGPLSPYVNGAWFALFGPSYRALVLLNALLAALIVRLTYRLLRSLAGRFATSAASALFVALFVFGDLVGEGNYNYLFPYSHEMTHGLLLGLLALRVVRRLHRSATGRDALGLGLLVGLAFLTKPEILLAVAAVAATGLALAPLDARGRHAALAALGALLPPVASFLLLLGPAGPEAALRTTLGPYPAILGSHVATSFYYRKGMGLDKGLGGLRGPLVTGGIELAAVVVVVLLGAAGRARALRPVVPVVAAALAAAGYVRVPRDWWFDVGLPLQLAVVAMIAAAWKGYRAAEVGARRREALRLAWLAMALALLVKMILFTRLWHYGFVLAAPAAILVVVELLEELPRRLAGRIHLPSYRAAAGMLLLLVVAAHLRLVERRLGAPGPLIGHGADAFRAGTRSGPLLVAALDEIERRTLPTDRVLVVPEGVMLNYLSRRLTSTRSVNFMPPELEVFGEAGSVAELAAHPAELVVLVHKDVSVPYGVGFFGKDFGRELWGGIARDYEELLVLGARPGEGDEFGVALYRRRAATHP